MSRVADVAAEAERRRERGEEFCLITVVRAQAATAAKAGCKALVSREGEVSGFIGGGCVERAAKKGAAAALEEGKARLIRVRPGDEVAGPVDDDGVELHKSGCPSRGTVDLFIEPMKPPPRLLVIGSSAVAAALAGQALALGYRVLAASAEENPEPLPGAAETFADLGFPPDAVGAGDFVVIATQGRRDLDALEAALASRAEYVSMVSSRRKAEHLLGRLKDKIPAERAARLKAPAGIDIQAIEPEEIALSIIAEIVQARRRGLRGSEG